MTDADAELIRGCKARILAVNLAVETVPFADVLYASDTGFWQQYDRRLRWFPGERVSIAPVSGYGVRQVGVCNDRLSRSGIWLGGLTDRNSGIQAVSLAYTRGADRIALLGHDGQVGPNGEKHCHEDHCYPLGNAGAVDRWPGAYSKMLKMLDAAGVRAVNCTRRTAHDWPRVPLEDFLEEIDGD